MSAGDPVTDDEAADERYMNMALVEARQAAANGDVPVGAVVVHEQTVVGRGHNRRVANNDPLAHAEVEAIRQAAHTLGSWRLDNCTVYVTLEPCPMCAGALVQARVGRVVYGADDSRHGALRSLYQLGDDPRAPHRMHVQRGTLVNECQMLLRQFFAERRLD